MRACAANRDAAALCGIPTRNMITLSFVLSAGIGALAGCVVSPITYTQYNIGTGLAIKGFTVAILGGLGNSMAAVAAGFILGILESFSIWVLPTAYKDAISISILLAMLFMQAQRPVREQGSHAVEGFLMRTSRFILRFWRSFGRGRPVQLLTLATGTAFYLTQLTMTAYYSLIVVGLCLLMGFAGQISLGHAGFFAIGGYTSAVAHHAEPVTLQGPGSCFGTVCSSASCRAGRTSTAGSCCQSIPGSPASSPCCSRSSSPGPSAFRC